MAKRNGNQPPTIDGLRAQRVDLAGRLAAVGGQLQRLDAVRDWELCARAAGEEQALTRAVALLDERIHAAELAQRDAARQEQDAERAARAAAARANLDAAARAYIDALLALPLAELSQAQAEMAACGAWPGPAAGVVIDAVRNIDGVFQRLRFVAPTWLGLPEPPSKEAIGLVDRQAAVDRAERLLADMRKLQREQRHGGPSVSYELLLTYAHGLAGARYNQLRLTEPTLTDHERTVKANSGINELSGWLGEYLERYHDAQRKAQQQEQAAGGVLA